MRNMPRWFKNDGHEKRFWDYWKAAKIDSPDPTDYREYGPALYILALLDKEFMSFIDEAEGVKFAELLDSAGAFSPGERDMVRLAAHLYDDTEWPESIHGCLGNLDTLNFQAALDAIMWAHRQYASWFMNTDHAREYIRMVTGHYSHRENIPFLSAMYVLSSLGRTALVWPAVADVRDGIASSRNDGRVDFDYLTSKLAHFGSGERAMIKLAAYLHNPHPANDCPLSEIFPRLDVNQARVAGEAIKLRFGEWVI